MKTANKINKTLATVDKARVTDLTSLRKTHEKFLDQNLKAYKDVAGKMKKADKAYVKASKTFENDGSVLNAHYLKEARAELDSCVSTFNVLTQNINSIIDAIKGIYDELNAAVKVTEPQRPSIPSVKFTAFVVQ